MLDRLNDERRVKNNTSGSRSADAFLSNDVFIAHSEKYSLDKLKQSLESIQKCGSESANPMIPILTIFLVPSKIVEKRVKQQTNYFPRLFGAELLNYKKKITRIAGGPFCLVLPW